MEKTFVEEYEEKYDREDALGCTIEEEEDSPIEEVRVTVSSKSHLAFAHRAATVCAEVKITSF